MRGIILGQGPQLKQHTNVGGTSNLDIYNMICKILHLNPAPNNGTQNASQNFLR